MGRDAEERGSSIWVPVTHMGDSCQASAFLLGKVMCSHGLSPSPGNFLNSLVKPPLLGDPGHCQQFKGHYAGSQGAGYHLLPCS